MVAERRQWRTFFTIFFFTLEKSKLFFCRTKKVHNKNEKLSFSILTDSVGNTLTSFFYPDAERNFPPETPFDLLFFFKFLWWGVYNCFYFYLKLEEIKVSCLVISPKRALMTFLVLINRPQRQFVGRRRGKKNGSKKRKSKEKNYSPRRTRIITHWEKLHL